MAKKSPDKTQKTNAARLLDRAGVAYRLVPYPVDEEHLEATHVAEALGEDIRQVYKTLVLRAGKQLFVCVIPGAEEVDLKKAARAIGAKKVEAMEKYTEPVEMKMMKEIKRALDPKNILNPGKVFNA